MAQTFLQSNREEERVAESLLWRVLRAGRIIYGGGCQNTGWTVTKGKLIEIVHKFDIYVAKIGKKN